MNTRATERSLAEVIEDLYMHGALSRDLASPHLSRHFTQVIEELRALLHVADSELEAERRKRKEVEHAAEQGAAHAGPCAALRPRRHAASSWSCRTDSSGAAAA